MENNASPSILALTDVIMCVRRMLSSVVNGFASVKGRAVSKDALTHPSHANSSSEVASRFLYGPSEEDASH